MGNPAREVVVPGGWTLLSRSPVSTGSDVEAGVTRNTARTSLGDLDGDGDLDLVTGNNAQVDKVYLGNGSGAFAVGSDVKAGVTLGTWDTSLGDLDGDGDLDLITGNYAQVNKVYLNNGSGAFSAGSDVEAGVTLGTFDTELGDLDGDGDLDLITGNNAQVNKVYLGNGSGTFAAGSDVEAGVTLGTWDTSLGDLDGDGDLDLITGNFTQVNKVYLNSGDTDGTLTASAVLDESSAIALPSTATTTGGAVDLCDFTFTDGGGGDGLALIASKAVVNASGTGPFSQVTWLLNGPDATNVSGSYSTNKITFSGLSISVADGSSETYTLRGYYSTNTSLTDGATFSFSIDGDTDVTALAGSSMSGSNAAVSNGVAGVVYVIAPQLARNQGARVGEDGTVLITTDLLQFTDAASTASQIVYTLSTASSVGQLKKSDAVLTVGSTFAQDDIDNQRLAYTHSGSELFGDHFSYTVKGTRGFATSAYSFGLTIDSVNDAPYFDVLEVLQVDEGGTIIATNGNLRVLDSDDHATALCYEVVSAPAYGLLSLGSFTQADIDAGRLTYRHDGSETTADVFEVRVSDAAGRAASAKLALAIGPVNDAPVIAPMGDLVVAEGAVVALPVVYSDAEGDAIDLRMEGLPEGAVLQDSLISWVPTYDQAGRYTVVLKADDGRGGQHQRRFTLEVHEAALPNLALIDFGDVPGGHIIERTYPLHNPTNLTMEITPPVTVDGPFVLVRPHQALSLAPGAMIEGPVRFTPPDRQSARQQATLNIQTNLGPIAIPVAGRSLWHQLVFDRALIDFGSVPVGGHTSQHIEIHNPGNAVPTVEAYSNDTPFVTTPARFELAPGASRWLRIKYAPRQPTREAALVRFFISAVPVQALPVQH